MELTLPTLNLDRILFLRKQRQTSKPKPPKAKPKAKSAKPAKSSQPAEQFEQIKLPKSQTELILLIKLIEEKLND